MLKYPLLSLPGSLTETLGHADLNVGGFIKETGKNT